MKPKPFTTGQVARMLGVSVKTAWKWCEKGVLASHQLPSGQHHRIMAGDLLEFCKRCGMPVPEELAHLLPVVVPPLRVLVGAAHDDAAPFVRAVQQLRPDSTWSSHWLIDLSFAAGDRWPDVVLLGCDEGLVSAVTAATVLLSRGQARVALVLDDSTTPDDERIDSVRDRLAWIGRRPVAWSEVVQAFAAPASGSTSRSSPVVACCR